MTTPGLLMDASLIYYAIYETKLQMDSLQNIRRVI